MGASLLEAVKQRVLLGDGGMGTQLMEHGLKQGACGEAWNLTHPDRVEAIQRAYVDAGSDCLITNTFGGSRIALARHAHAHQAAEINRAAVQIARRAFGDKPGFVLGDIGPFGGMLEPFGDYTHAEVAAAFSEQAQALVEAGADAVIVETQTSLDELRLGIEAARAAGAPCVIGSMAFDVSRDGTKFRTMMGVTPEQAAEAMVELRVDILALNCGAGMDMPHALPVVRQYRSITQLPIMAQPNAGQPLTVDGKLVYNATPDEMAAGVAALLDAGVGILGACCGSTPRHIQAMRAQLDACAAGC